MCKYKERVVVIGSVGYWIVIFSHFYYDKSKRTWDQICFAVAPLQLHLLTFLLENVPFYNVQLEKIK